MKLSREAKSLLAGQYVLGTLRGGARRRFETLAKQDPELQVLIRTYAQGLQPLADRLPPVTPPARVWSAIEDALDGRAKAASVVSQGVPAVAQGLGNMVAGWWRWLGMGAAGLAAGFAAFSVYNLMNPPVAPPPQVVVKEIIKEVPGDPGKAFTQLAGGWDTWAVLSSKGGAELIVCGNSKTKRIWVMQARNQTLAPNTALELWSVPGSGGAPQSLGVIAAPQSNANVRAIELPMSVLERLTGTAALAVSVEPPGGSPTGAPTGAVLMQGSLLIKS